MTLARYETPFESPVVRRLFERVMDGWNTDWPSAAAEEGTLPVDIYETPDEVVVRTYVPGFKKDNVHVVLEKGVLSIKAEATPPQTEENARFYRRELDWRSLSRRIALPGIVDDARVKAELRDGVLTLRIPVAEQAKPRHIEIKG